MRDVLFQRVIGSVPDADKYIATARAIGRSLPNGGSRIWVVGDVRIYVQRNQDQVIIKLDGGQLGIRYEFFTIDENQNLSGNPEGYFSGVTLFAKRNNQKIVRKYGKTTADLRLLDEDPNTIQFIPTWTARSWGRVIPRYVFYKDDLRLVSSAASVSPELNPNSIRLYSPMQNPGWGLLTLQSYGSITPALYRRDTTIRGFGLSGLEGTVSTAGIQTVEHDEHGARNFIIQTDDEGWFYCYPLIEDASVTANVRFERATLPAGVKTKPDGKLLRLQTVAWKFNSTGTKAVTTFIHTDDSLDSIDYIKIEHPEGVVRLASFEEAGVKVTPKDKFYLGGVAPRLLEVEIKISVTGPELDDFTFSLKTAQSYFPEDKFLFGADYAYDHSALQKKGVDPDDLMVFTYEVYSKNEDGDDGFRYLEDMHSVYLYLSVDATPADQKKLFEGIPFTKLNNGEVFASFYNLTKDKVVKEFPIYTNANFTSAPQPATATDYTEFTDSTAYDAYREGFPVTDDPFIRGRLYSVDLRSLSIAIQYERFKDGDDFEAIIKDKKYDTYKAYFVVYTHVDKEIYFDSIGVSAVNENADRFHETIKVVKKRKIKLTDDRYVFHNCVYNNADTFLNTDFSSHPDGHISFCLSPLKGEVDNKVIKQTEVDVICMYQKGQYFLFTHKEALAKANGVDRPYSYYHNGSPNESHRTWGYWI